MDLRPAVHRTILVVDVEGFGDRQRTNHHQVAVRAGMYQVLEQAFRHACLPWADCHREDRGDGVFVLAPADVSKSLFVDVLPHALVRELGAHNVTHPAAAKIRLRMALHAGELNYDDHGVTGASINLAFRLLDASPLKAALASSPGVLTLITSSWFFDEVVRHSPGGTAASYRPVKVVAKETVTVGWISLPDHPYPASEPLVPQVDLGSPRPRQLPAHTRHFVGRVEELRQLTTQLDAAGGSVVIAAINGTAGVGKTTLAVHWAHQAKSRFPDGQLYVNLRGFHPSGTPMQPAEAIRGFLDAFEVPHERIPSGFDAQVALYRSLLADRRVLVVLDNARDAEQVRPLLPGSSASLVVVTSREQLIDLITREGAQPLNLDAFNPKEATALLARRIGQPRVTAEPDAVRELIERCGRLPLALAIVAARIELNPRLSLRMLADEIADESTTLHVLNDLRAVFAWSYQHLEAPVARMFRLLGLHPGPEVSLAAAASIAGAPVDKARTMLAELARAHLLVEPIPGRFAFHDLLRVYASEQAAIVDVGSVRREANHRMLDHYLYMAHTASDYVFAWYQYAPADYAPVDGRPHPNVALDTVHDYKQAVNWLAVEYRTLLAIVHHAYHTEFDAHAWKLTWSLAAFQEWTGRWRDAFTVQESLLAAADRTGDRFAQGRAHLLLAWSFARLGQHTEAQAQSKQSLDLCMQVGDHFGEAGNHFVLAMTYALQQRESDAFEHAERVLDHFQGPGNQCWLARTHRLYAWIYGRCGNYMQSVYHCEHALHLLDHFDDLQYEVATLENLLAWTHSRLGNYEQAITYYTRAISGYNQIADHYNTADVLRRLGDVYQFMGDGATARVMWLKALKSLESVNLSDDDPILTKLNKRIKREP